MHVRLPARPGRGTAAAVSTAPGRVEIARVLALAAVVLAPRTVVAQVSAGVRLDSDDRFRGVSLSAHRPAAHVDVGADFSGGAFAGASLSTSSFDGASRGLALLGYAGLARRTAPGQGWEAGAMAVHFAQESHYDYGEAFVGVSRGAWHARASLSPAYFGLHVRTAYLELDATATPTPSLRVFARMGLLARLSGLEGWVGTRRTRADASMGVGVELGAWGLQLARVAAGRGGPYPFRYAPEPDAWVASVSFAF